LQAKEGAELGALRPHGHPGAGENCDTGRRCEVLTYMALGG